MHSRQILSRLVAALSLALLAPCLSHAQDSSPRTQFVTVEKDVRLEVLDWGGTGRPLVLLAGLGDTAHVFDQFAPQFTAHDHVYGITRRGFGASSKPAPTDANYSVARLGEDVIAVLDALRLSHPVLAGHSIAGAELSYVGTHDPQKVAGLIYIDAADGYGFYDQGRGDTEIDLLELKRRLDVFRAGAVYDRAFVEGLLASTRQLTQDLEQQEQRYAEIPNLPPPPPPPPIPLAIRFGLEKFTKIDAPAMAIFACPHDMRPAFRGALQQDRMAQAALRADDLKRCTDQSNAFERAMPSDPVVRIADANHYAFRSNPEIVARAMNDFMARLR